MQLRFLVLAGAVLAAACKKEEARPAADTTAARDTVLTVSDGFRTPESVLYDSVLDTYIVSNINGSPFDKDDNGFLSRVAPDGHTVELRWVDGASDGVTLNAPKGMAIKGDTLFVADIEVVRLFDRASGAPLGVLPTPGATFLNDVTVGADGAVYVTDTGLRPGFEPSGSDAVWRIVSGSRPRPLVRDTSLGQPNGVWPSGGGVIVVGWKGAVYYLDSTGRRTDLPRPPHGQLDGVIVRPGDGWIITSSWADSSIVGKFANQAWSTVATGLEAPADIGYDSRRDRLLIPLFNANRIVIRPLR